MMLDIFLIFGPVLFNEQRYFESHDIQSIFHLFICFYGSILFKNNNIHTGAKNCNFPKLSPITSTSVVSDPVFPLASVAMHV